MLVAGSAEEALNHHRRAKPDLCLIDLAMVSHEGQPFCEMLKGGRSSRRVPMIVISDLSPPETARQGIAVGAEDFLVRPFSPPELLLRVRQSLNRLAESRALTVAHEDLDVILRRTQSDLDSLRRRVRTQKGGLQTLLDFNRRLDPTDDEAELEQTCLTQAALLGHSAGACLFRLSEGDEHWLSPSRWQGISPDELNGLRLPVAGEFLEILAANGSPVRLTEFERVPGTSLEAGTLSAAGFAIAAPLVLKGELVGLLALAEEARGDRDADLEAIGLFAGSVAHLLEASRLRRQDRDMAMGTLGALVDRLEGQYPDLAGHSRRVTQMALATGRRLQLARPDLDVLRVAGQLHDLGRLLNDTDILVRPGPLSDADWQRVRRHPGDAAAIAAEARWPEVVQSAIRHHRERWSGEGYPGGLKKDAIPMHSRILGGSEWGMRKPDTSCSPSPDAGTIRRLSRPCSRSKRNPTSWTWRVNPLNYSRIDNWMIAGPGRLMGRPIPTRNQRPPAAATSKFVDACHGLG
ncbi:MAG: response regulator receiver modulated metal dependent phosphohydrolase [bacterium]|nr:MAG: response regulator receiver modulated metal dependent phosphohydrolase [bacterium]